MRIHNQQQAARFVIALGVAMLLIVTTLGEARADRVSDLSKRLSGSDSDKVRISAAVSLGRSKDKRALKPLVLALRDKNVSVRQVAAAALGGLGDSRALPALQRATRDSNRAVRKHATRAIGAIRHNGNLSRSSQTTGNKSGPQKTRRMVRYQVSGRELPRLSPRKPTAYLKIRTATDESKSPSTKKTRAGRADTMAKLMLGSLQSTNHFTTNLAIASDYKLPHYNLDLSITRLQRVVNGPWIELECEIRVAISHDNGKLISFLTGGAKIQLPKQTFRAEFEANMRKEALENAVKGIHADLLRYLAKNTGV